MEEDECWEIAKASQKHASTNPMKKMCIKQDK